MIISYRIDDACPNGLNPREVYGEIQDQIDAAFSMQWDGRIISVDVAGEKRPERVTRSRPGLPENDLHFDFIRDLTFPEIETLTAILQASGPSDPDRPPFICRLRHLKRRYAQDSVGTFRFVENLGAGTLVYKAPDGWRAVASDSLVDLSGA